MSTASARTQRGFTLLELAVVLALIGVITGMGLVTLIGAIQASQVNKTVERMDAIEKVLLNYAVAFGRIPCPSSLTLTPSNVNYGIEAANQGSCTGGTPAANFAAASGAVEGGVPTRALQLPDEYMYDGWGRRLRYAVDPIYTAANVLPIIAGGPCTASATAITVNDSTGAARTTAAIYAIVSSGANGHGAYTSNGVMVNAGSTNTDEQTNCHCNASAVPTTYAPTYVEKAATQSSTSALNNFDDIVTFKEAWQMQAQNFPLVSGSCGQYIYVSDAGGNRVEVFNSSGSYLRQIGCSGTNACSAGSGNGQFNVASGVTIDTSGNLWAADWTNGRLEKFNSSGSFLSATANLDSSTSASIPAFDTSGNLWLTTYGGCDVLKLNSSGSFVTAYGSCGHTNGKFNASPNGLAIDSGGNLWLPDCGNNRVQKFNSSGSYVSQIGGCSSGKCTAGSGNGQFSCPNGIAIDGGGNFWVTDQVNSRVEEFNSSGSYLLQFGSNGTGNGQFSTNINYIAVDASGNLWVTDATNDTVQKFNSSGSYLLGFGSGGSGAGQFNSTGNSGACGIAVGGR